MNQGKIVLLAVGIFGAAMKLMFGAATQPSEVFTEPQPASIQSPSAFPAESDTPVPPQRP